MTASNDAPSPFSEVTPNLQLVWDATSLGWLKTCPRYYQYKMLEGWTPKKMAAPLSFGIFFHNAIEAFDKAIVAGDPFKVALRKAVKQVLSDTRIPTYKTICSDCGEEWHAGWSVCGYCGSEESYVEEGWEPWETDRPERNRWTLLRAVVWYIDYYGHDDSLQTYVLSNGSAAIELTFKMPSGVQTQDGEEFMFSGHFDKVADIGNGIYVQDRKTTGGRLDDKFFESFTPNNQFSLYTLASRVVFSVPALGSVIDGIQLGAGFNRFGRGFAYRTPKQLEEWLRDAGVWLRIAEQYAREGYWPQNDTACGMYGGCPFREICGKDPAVRSRYLESNFIRSYWNPLQER